MLLSYIDESGKNYQKSNGFFVDGAFAVWTAILIPETKYFHTEQLFQFLAKRNLGIKNWKKEELHATDIWQRKGNFSNLSEQDARNYFEELFQLLAKLNIKVVVGVQCKNPRLRSKESKNREIDLAMGSLLTSLEHKLSEMSTTAVLIADKPGESLERLQSLIYERTAWRQNVGERKFKKFLSKYYFENMSCFLVDQVHYVNSKDSLFVQLADQVSFVIQRILTYSYLKTYPETKRPHADLGKSPITVDTFSFFCKNLSVTCFSKEKKDFLILEGSDLGAFPRSETFVSDTCVELLSTGGTKS